MALETPSTKVLLWPVAVAALLLVTVVLPAEYGIDWTGAGQALGLTAMGEQKVAAAKTAAASPQASVAPAAAPADAVRYAEPASRPLRTDTIDVTLAPGGQIEYKAILGEGESIVYEWDAGAADLDFDFHGEPAAGPQGAFLSFEKGRASKGAGSLKAPFAGTHGWYWRNRTAATVVIKLKVSGFHAEMKKM